MPVRRPALGARNRAAPAASALGRTVVLALIAGSTGCTSGTAALTDDWRPLYAESYVAAVREAQGDAAGAAQAFRRAAELAPGVPLWRVAEGEAWIAAGFVADGIITLRAAADDSLLDPTPRLRLAAAIWLSTGNRPVAEAELATAAAQFPADWRVIDAWSELLTVWDGPHAAARKWEAAERTLSQPDIARWRAGLAWRDAGVHRRTLAAWLRIESPNAGHRARIARAALEAGKLEVALTYSSPTDPSIAGRRAHAQVLERIRRWTDAVAAWKAVIAIAPADVDAHLQLSHILLLELDQPAAAARYVPIAWELARRHDSPDGLLQRRARLLMGILAERAGDWTAAIAAYRDCYRMDPSPRFAGHLGRAWWRGPADTGQAIPLLEQAAPALDSPALWWWLGECYGKEQAWAKARSAYHSAAAAGRPQAEVDARLRTLPPE